MNDESREGRPVGVQPPKHETSEYLVFGQVADEVEECLRAGRKPDVEALASQHPDMADQILELVPALATLHELGRRSETAPNDVATGQLGDYRILREIGRGGMGVVYEAQQISLNRKVALKVLPFAAVLDERQLARFKNEAQAAATLTHQNIVPVYSVGCERGVHYYAMQFIDGQTLAEVIAGLRHAEGQKSEHGQALAQAPGTSDEAPASAAGSSDLVSQLARGKFAPPANRAGSVEATVDSAPKPRDQAESKDTAAPVAAASDTAPIAQLSTKDATRQPAYFRTAARLGIQVAAALDYAHQRGIVHRDIKPSNLLLDSTGNPWVTDFGLALVEADPGLTMTGDIVGTLRYMSPEQALAKRVVIDHRTDVYSLGVTLYELLTLQPAFPGRDRQELLRKIAFEDPKSPSKINRAVPPDLETIVLKATAKNPHERYGTAAEVADDLRRYLDDKPIKARRPSFAQLAAKWSRRHKAVVRAVAATLVVGVVIAGALLWRERSQTLAAFAEARENLTLAEQNAQRANTEAETAQQVTDFLVGLFEGDEGSWMGYRLGTSRERGENLTARNILDRGAERITRELKDRPLMQAKMMDTIGYIYRSQGMLREAEPLLEGALAIRRENLGNQHADIATSLDHIAWLRNDIGDFELSEALFREALAMRKSQLGFEHALVADSMFNLGNSLAMSDLNQHGIEIILLHRRALAVRRKLYGDEHRDVAFSMSILGLVLAMSDQSQEAEPLIREAKRMFLKLEGERHLGIAAVRFGESQLALASGDEVEAVRLHQEAVAMARDMIGETPLTAYLIGTFADSLVDHDPQQAENLYREVLAIHRKAYGDDHRKVAGNMYGLADTLSQQGKHEEAEEFYRGALAIRRNYPDDEKSWYVANYIFFLALRGLSPQGKFDEAEQFYREAIAIYSKAIELDITGPSIGNRGHTFAELGQWQDAASDFIQTPERDDTGYNARTLHCAALAQLAAGDPDGYRRTCDTMLARFAETEDAVVAGFVTGTCVAVPDAVDDFSQVIQLAERALQSDPDNASYLRKLGQVLYRAGRFDEALVRLNEANLLLNNPSHESDTLPPYSLFFFQAMTHYRLGNVDEAQAWLNRALVWTDEEMFAHAAATGAANWNFRLTLRLLSAEAEELFGVSDTETTEKQAVAP